MAIVNHGRRLQVLLWRKFAQSLEAAIIEAGPPQTLGSGLAGRGEILDVTHTFYSGFLSDQYSCTVVGGIDTCFAKTGTFATIEKSPDPYG